MTPPIKTVRYTFAKSGPDDKTSRDTPGRAPHLATYPLFEWANASIRLILKRLKCRLINRKKGL